MEYSVQRVGVFYIVREHELGGYGDPWTGWSCLAEPRGDAVVIHAAPGKPKDTHKLFRLAIQEGFSKIIWSRWSPTGLREVIINLDRYR